MFDIGWTELLVVAVVMILVVGPKDLPRMLRTFGQTLGKVRRMASDFQSTFNDALREAEQQADIADMKSQVEKAANFDPLGDLKKSIDIDKATKPKAKAAGAQSAGTQSAGNGATAGTKDAAADAGNAPDAAGKPGGADAQGPATSAAASAGAQGDNDEQAPKTAGDGKA
ncbi:Sec-independent protein translocase protein TatB [Stappia sp.]|uniref:Sec-independent protein translocase protein TatB n=1 Tax=Stappia sp. TaxID=1870903 RepID=UPI003A9A09F7